MTNSPRSDAVFAPASLGRLRLRNRVMKAATFEGVCASGRPSAALIEHHRALARGGVGMTTVAYCSVSADGRTYGHQMWMRREIVAELRQLTDAVHEEGGAVSLQLGHAGYFAEQQVIGRRPIGPSRLFNLYGLSLCREATAGDMARLVDDFTRSAQLAVEAGFDAIELHVGHGYLLSQYLSPFTNRRRDEYGGALRQRLRFVLDVVRAMRGAIPPDFPLLAKTNVRDGFSGGLELDEAVVVAQALERHGVNAIVPSGGFVSKTPLYMLKGEVPIDDMVEVQDTLHRKVGLRLFGRFFVKQYPYRPMFFWDEASAIRDAVNIPVVLLGGITALAHMEQALAAGFDFVMIGRALIHDPNLLLKLQRGELTGSQCRPCNRCIAEMDRGGVRCVQQPQNA